MCPALPRTRTSATFESTYTTCIYIQVQSSNLDSLFVALLVTQREALFLLVMGFFIWSPKSWGYQSVAFLDLGPGHGDQWGPCRIAGSYVECMGCVYGFNVVLTWVEIFPSHTSPLPLGLFYACFRDVFFLHVWVFMLWNIWINHGIIFKWFMQRWGGRLWHRFLASKFQSPQVHSGNTRPFPQRTGIPFDRWRL